MGGAIAVEDNVIREQPAGHRSDACDRWAGCPGRKGRGKHRTYVRISRSAGVTARPPFRHAKLAGSPTRSPRKVAGMARGHPSTAPCVFCGAPSSRHGEHVPPRWFLRRWHGEGPFTYEVNGEPILTRDASPRKASDLPSSRLPVCDQRSGRDCNGALNRLYEQLGKRHVRAVLDQAQVLDGTELVAAFARWWIKTILLLQHPTAASAFPGAASGNAWERGTAASACGTWPGCVACSSP